MFCRRSISIQSFEFDCTLNEMCWLCFDNSSWYYYYYFIVFSFVHLKIIINLLIQIALDFAILVVVSEVFLMCEEISELDTLSSSYYDSYDESESKNDKHK